MNRRVFLASAGAALVGPIDLSMLQAQDKARPKTTLTESIASKADYTLKIEPCSIEISPGGTIKTVAYNGQVPGPLLRLREGTPVKIDVIKVMPMETVAVEFLADNPGNSLLHGHMQFHMDYGFM